MFKNLNQLKNNVEVGQKVTVKSYLRDTEEERIVIKKQSNGIYTGKEITKEVYQEKRNSFITKNNVIEVRGKYYTKTFLEYQKAKQMKFDENVVKLLAFNKKSYNSEVRSPSLDFEVGDTWLELIFE